MRESPTCPADPCLDCPTPKRCNAYARRALAHRVDYWFHLGLAVVALAWAVWDTLRGRRASR